MFWKVNLLPSWLLHLPSQRISEPSLELGMLHSHPSTSEEYPQSLFILPFFIWRSGVPEIRQLSMEASVVLEFWSPNTRHLSEQDLWVVLSLPLDWVLSHWNRHTTYLHIQIYFFHSIYTEYILKLNFLCCIWNKWLPSCWVHIFNLLYNTLF